VTCSVGILCVVSGPISPSCRPAPPPPSVVVRPAAASVVVYLSVLFSSSDAYVRPVASVAASRLVGASPLLFPLPIFVVVWLLISRACVPSVARPSAFVRLRVSAPKFVSLFSPSLSFSSPSVCHLLFLVTRPFAHRRSPPDLLLQLRLPVLSCLYFFGLSFVLVKVPSDL